MSEDAGIEPRTFAILALIARRARFHQQKAVCSKGNTVTCDCDFHLFDSLSVVKSSMDLELHVGSLWG